MNTFFNKILGILAVFICFINPVSLSADFPVPNTNWIGTNVQQPLTTMNLSWNISLNSGVYTYLYSITGSASLPNELVLEVNPSYTNQNLSSLITHLTAGVNMSVITATAHNEPTLTYIDFTNLGNSLSFQTLSAPVWGSFQVFDNLGNTGFNANAGIPPTASTANGSNYVPTVGLAAPEPKTWLLMGSALLAAGLITNRTRVCRL